MNVGDLATHDNVNGILRILRFSKSLAVCENIEQEKVYYSGLDMMTYPRCICKIKSLKKFDQLFFNFG